jgi:NitT/TauT family transport system permease protein
VGRQSWFAIRTPLSPRRATFAKVGSFVIPLGIWAGICAAWRPDIVITDQGDGRYKPGDRMAVAQFDAENNRLRASRTEPTIILTDQSLEALRSTGGAEGKAVPESVLAKLKGLKGVRYDSQKEFLENVADELSDKEFQAYKDIILAQAEKKDVQLMAGDRATKIWLPPPHQVAKAFYDAFVTGPAFPGEPWMHQSLWHSCKIIFWGFILSAIVGVPLGVLCGTFDVFSKLSEPFIDFIRYMPAPAFGALLVAVLDIYDESKIAIIWIGTFFQMVLVVANTTRQFDESLLEAAQTLGASRRSLLTKVILPGILPSLYNDMRILLGWAWTYLIVAELIGASSGISHFIWMQGKYRQFQNVYAGIIMIGLIGLICDQILAAIARYLFPWVPRKEGSGAWAGFFAALAGLFGTRRKPAVAGAKA